MYNFFWLNSSDKVVSIYWKYLWTWDLVTSDIWFLWDEERLNKDTQPKDKLVNDKIIDKSGRVLINNLGVYKNLLKSKSISNNKYLGFFYKSFNSIYENCDYFDDLWNKKFTNWTLWTKILYLLPDTNNSDIEKLNNIFIGEYFYLPCYKNFDDLYWKNKINFYFDNFSNWNTLLKIRLYYFKRILNSIKKQKTIIFYTNLKEKVILFDKIFNKRKSIKLSGNYHEIIYRAYEVWNHKIYILKGHLSYFEWDKLQLLKTLL